MKTKKQKTESKNNGVKYYGSVPEKVLEELTPEVRSQYFIWDEILKRQIEKYPELLFPLVREIFGKEYPENTEIQFLSTEYVVEKVYGQGQKLLESIRSDLLVRIGDDLYHMECQMERGGNIAVRMLEYDMNSALVHGLKQVPDEEGGRAVKFEVNFPHSAILYLDGAGDIPASGMESCIIVYPDGTKYEYRIPVLNAQGYTPETAGEKGLAVLLPFMMVRFRSQFERILKKTGSPDKTKAAKAHEEMEALKKDLTKMAEDCIMIINREEETGRMSGRMGADIMELMGKTCDYLFKREPRLLKEVHAVMGPVIKLHSEELEEKIAMQQEELKEKEIQLIRQREQLKQQKEQMNQQKEQLDKLIKNYIHSSQKDGKTDLQTEQSLQEIFSLTPKDAKELLKKYW